METVLDKIVILLFSNRSGIRAFDRYWNRWPWMTLNGVMAVI